MTEAEQTAQNNRGKWILLIMALVFGAPYLGSVLLYRMSDDLDLKTKNYGQMLQPSSILEFEFSDADGQAISQTELSGYWQIVQVVNSACNEVCVNNLYKMRQVRKALGVPRFKLQRNVLLLDLQDIDAFMQAMEAFEGTRILVLNKEDAGKLLAPLNTRPGELFNHMLLIDPLGNLIMHYRPDAEPKGMLGDLEILVNSEVQGGVKE